MDQPCLIHTPAPWATSTRASRLPSNWSTIRQAVRKRDHGTCQACDGAKCGNRQLEVHHIGSPDDHRLANLVLLGHNPCHDEITTTQSKAARHHTP